MAIFWLKEPDGACFPNQSFPEPRDMRRHKIRDSGDENVVIEGKSIHHEM